MSPASRPPAAVADSLLPGPRDSSPLAQLGDPLQPDNANLAGSTAGPVSLTPACASVALVDVHEHCSQPLEGSSTRKGARVDAARPLGDPVGELERDRLRVLARRRTRVHLPRGASAAPSERAASECRPATTGPATTRLHALGQGESVCSGNGPLPSETELGSDAEEWLLADGVAQLLRRSPASAASAFPSPAR